MKLGRSAFLMVSGGLVVALSGCGQPVCVAGVGNCKAYTDRAAEAGTTTPGTRPGSAGATGLPANPKFPFLGCASGGQCWVERGKTLSLYTMGGSGTYAVTVTQGRENGDVSQQGQNWVFTPNNSATTGSKSHLRLTAGGGSGPMSEVDVTIVAPNEY